MARYSTVEVDRGTHVDLQLTNATDHTVNLSSSAFDTTVGLYPGPVDGNGRPTRAIDSDAADVGTVRCEGVLVGTHGPANDLPFVAVLANVVPATITVVPPPATTTTD